MPHSAVMSKTSQCSLVTTTIDQLPDDVLVHILSFLTNLSEIARTSVLSRRWRNLWHHTSSLDFDATTVLPIDLLETSHAWYVEWVNKVIDARVALPGLPLLKELWIHYELDESQCCHIDRWINFAIANRVEILCLDFKAYLGLVPESDQYKLTEEPWYIAPSGLSSIACLKSLSLSCVNVNKQFIEFILSSCPLLEDLVLHNAGGYQDLNISGVLPLPLRRLRIRLAKDFALTELSAPYLTSFYYQARKFRPQKIDVPMLTDLTIGSMSGSQPLLGYLQPFWSYLPQLEKLELIMDKARSFRLRPLSELVKLKYLKLHISVGDCDLAFYQIINFVNACPLLETFALEMSSVEEGSFCSQPRYRNKLKQEYKKQKWHKGRSFRCLKVLELCCAREETIEQEVVIFIVRNADHLEKLIVDTRLPPYGIDVMTPEEQEIVDAAEVKARELCRESRSEIKLIVVSV